MTAFIRAKLKKSDRQTNNDKIRVAALKISQIVIKGQDFDLLLH